MAEPSRPPKDVIPSTVEGPPISSDGHPADSKRVAITIKKLAELEAKLEEVSDAARHALNEQARLYPWILFDQTELRIMTGLPRQAVSAFFDAPDFPAQFGRSRPEQLILWIATLDRKLLNKNVKA